MLHEFGDDAHVFVGVREVRHVTAAVEGVALNLWDCCRDFVEDHAEEGRTVRTLHDEQRLLERRKPNQIDRLRRFRIRASLIGVMGMSVPTFRTNATVQAGLARVLQ